MLCTVNYSISPLSIYNHHVYHHVMKRKSLEMREVRASLSGNSKNQQFQSEISLLNKEDRQQLLKSSVMTTEVSTDQSLAMKADLSIPKSKLRVHHRC